MRIIYTCPKCGGDLQEVMLATNPPIQKKQCMSCGWSYTDTDREDVLRVPFEPPTERKAVDYQSVDDHKCHTCKHYTSGEHDGSCGSYICEHYSNWESEDKE